MLYQPIVALATGTIDGLEALVRWDHPDRGRLPPSEFIPLAEETGLIVPIGRWVLRDVARQLRRWLDDGTVGDTMVVSVNLSAAQLSQPDLASVTAEVLDECGIAPARVCLELTAHSCSASTTNPPTTPSPGP